jgi:hypothetical protein
MKIRQSAILKEHNMTYNRTNKESQEGRTKIDLESDSSVEI